MTISTPILFVVILVAAAVFISLIFTRLAYFKDSIPPSLESGPAIYKNGVRPIPLQTKSNSMNFKEEILLEQSEKRDEDEWSEASTFDLSPRMDRFLLPPATPLPPVPIILKNELKNKKFRPLARNNLTPSTSSLPLSESDPFLYVSGSSPIIDGKSELKKDISELSFYSVPSEEFTIRKK